MPALLIAVLLALAAPAAAQPENVILFIGDGMGPEHVRAASIYATGTPGGLAFQDFPHGARVLTRSRSGITDSAAAATAIATGLRVANGVLSMYPEGDGSREPETLLELAKCTGRGTGLVTTAFLTHATPAAFAAHEPSRYRYDAIARDYLKRSRPTVLLGGGGRGLTATVARAHGYSIVESLADLRTGTEVEAEADAVIGLFGTGHLPYTVDRSVDRSNGGFRHPVPSLQEMTTAAIRLLEERGGGYFLLVEGARIDHASHQNDLLRAVTETVAFAEAVGSAAAMTDPGETLIVVTADHETGGLRLVSESGSDTSESDGNANGAENTLPEAAWSTEGHTATDVPLYARGPFAEEFRGWLPLNEIHGILERALAQ